MGEGGVVVFLGGEESEKNKTNIFVLLINSTVKLP